MAPKLRVQKSTLNTTTGFTFEPHLLPPVDKTLKKPSRGSVKHYDLLLALQKPTATLYRYQGKEDDNEGGGLTHLDFGISARIFSHFGYTI